MRSLSSSSRCRKESLHVGRDAEGHRVWSPLLHPCQTRHDQRQWLPQRSDHVQMQTGRTRCNWQQVQVSVVASDAILNFMWVIKPQEQSLIDVVE